MPLVPIVLSDEEAEELYRYTLNSYISPMAYPALSKLLDRVSEWSRSSQRRDAGSTHAADVKGG